MADIFNLIGSLICHQLPSRTICAQGIPLPVCARDTGIYLGFFAGMVFITATGRLDSDKPPGTGLSIFLCVLMLPMVSDGLLSYAGLLGTDNVKRLFTGALFGIAIPFFLIPAARFKVYGYNRKAVLAGPAELAAVILFAALLCAAVLMDLIPYILIGLILSASIIFFIGRLTYTVIMRIKPVSKYRFPSAAGATLGVLMILYLLSAYILQPLKDMLLK